MCSPFTLFPELLIADPLSKRRRRSDGGPNSTGQPGGLDAIGSNTAALNALTLRANELPPGQFGYFVATQSTGMVTPPGSQGLLCLSGSIARFNSSIFQGPSGALQVDLTSIPVSPPTAVLPGDTWAFQCWYRDQNPSNTSNFTDAVSIDFL